MDKSRNIKFDLADIKRQIKTAEKLSNTLILDWLGNELQKLLNEYWDTEYRNELRDLLTDCNEAYIQLTYLEIKNMLTGY